MSAVDCAGSGYGLGPEAAGEDRWRWHRFVQLWAQSQAQLTAWAEAHLPRGAYYRLRIEDLAGRRPLDEKVNAEPPPCAGIILTRRCKRLLERNFAQSSNRAP